MIEVYYTIPIRPDKFGTDYYSPSMEPIYTNEMEDCCGISSLINKEKRDLIRIGYKPEVNIQKINKDIFASIRFEKCCYNEMHMNEEIISTNRSLIEKYLKKLKVENL